MAVAGSHFRGVPLADLDRFLLGLGVFLESSLGAADGEDVAVVALLTLDLDALGPALAVALDVDQAAAVAVLEELPIEADDVILVAAMGVEVAVRIAGDVNGAVLDLEGIVIILAEDVQLEVVHGLAVKERHEALFNGIIGPNERSGQNQGGESQDEIAHH